MNISQKTLPPLNLLKTFEVVSRHRSFKLAAAELNITPPAVTYQVKKLEDFLNIDLFERKSRGVVLTRIGYQYQLKLKSHLDSIESLTRKIMEGENQQRIIISGETDLIRNFVVALAPHYKKRKPNVKFVFFAKEEGYSLEKGNVDVEIGFNRNHRGSIESHVFSPLYFSPVCSPKYWEEHGEKDSIKNLVIDAEYNHFCWKLWSQEWGVELNQDSPISMMSSEYVRQAINDGVGIGMGFFPWYNPYLAANQMVQPFPNKISTFGPLIVSGKKDVLESDVVTDLIDWMDNLSRT